MSRTLDIPAYCASTLRARLLRETRRIIAQYYLAQEVRVLNRRIDSIVRPAAFGELDSTLDRTRKAIRLADYEAAEGLLKEAQQRRDREAAEYYNLLGALHEGRKKWRRARKCYAKANALLNNYQPARVNLQRNGIGQPVLGDEETGVWYAKLS